MAFADLSSHMTGYYQLEIVTAVKVDVVALTYRWVNIDRGQLRTCLAEQQAEAHNGPTELTEKQFVWPQQPDGSS